MSPIRIAGEGETASETAASPLDQTPLPVRWWLLAAITVPLIVLNTGWIANSEMKTGVTEITISSLFMGVTFLLFAATLVNLAARRYLGSGASLNQPEMMALYTMLSISSVVAGVGHFGFFMPYLAAPFDPHVASSDWRYWIYLLPSSIGPRDPAVLRPFFDGHSTFFRAQFMHAWAYPVTVWSIFFLVLMWTTLCVAVMLRQRWEEKEHLPFPVIALPLEMTREGAPLYSNRYLWFGFAIPAFLHSLNSLHSIYPNLPSLAINSVHDYVFLFGPPSPWSGMGTFFYMLHPAGVGFGYLINTDVSFSLWFFYLLKKAVDVAAVALGLRSADLSWGADADGQFPYYSAQGWGAWIILGLVALWAARKEIARFVSAAFGADRAQRSSADAIDPRIAVFGFLGGFLALCAYVWSMGGSWWLPVVFLGIYFILMVTMSRIRAETAVLSSELAWINPQSMIPTIIGTESMSHTDLVHMGMLSWFNTDYRAPAMPHELEGLVGQHRTRGKVSPMVTAIMLAAVVAIIAAALWDLQLYYVNGAATGNVNQWRIQKGAEPWNDVQGWIQNPKGPDGGMISGMLFGIAFTLLLSLIRLRFVGFPFHPAGYALNMSFANEFFWGDMLVAWAVKSCILRYGGMRTYRAALPFFLGLILGDFVTGSAWSIFGTIFHLSLFRTFAT